MNPGSCKGSVPFIIDLMRDFNGDQTTDLDLSTRVPKPQVACKGEAIAVANSKVTFPNTGTTGDCMGDALDL